MMNSENVLSLAYNLVAEDLTDTEAFEAWHSDILAYAESTKRSNLLLTNDKLLQKKLINSQSDRSVDIKEFSEDIDIEVLHELLRQRSAHCVVNRIGGLNRSLRTLIEKCDNYGIPLFITTIIDTVESDQSSTDSNFLKKFKTKTALEISSATSVELPKVLENTGNIIIKTQDRASSQITTALINQLIAIVKSAHELDRSVSEKTLDSHDKTLKRPVC